MLHRLLTPLVLLAHLFQSTPYEQMITRVQMSVVRIDVAADEGQGTCTGEVVAPGRVLTAAHCLGEVILADGQSAQPIAIDEGNDLLLLAAQVARPPLPLCMTPTEKYQPLTAMGYAWGWSRMAVLRVVAMWMHYTPDANSFAPGLFTDGGYIGGMSGGPVVSDEGCQVGIVQRTSPDGKVGYGVENDTIAEFLASVVEN